MRTAVLLALAGCALVAADSRPHLAVLRGGDARFGGTPVRRYQFESGRPVVEYSQQRPASTSILPEEPSMSDAERVYVLQQFERPAVRKAFLQRVYSTVSVQLLLTAAVVALLRGSPAVALQMLHRLGIGLFFLPMVPLLLLQYMPNQRQASSPAAYLLLALFTVLEGLAIGAATLPVPLQMILRAAGTTAAATLGLSFYALTTKRDFTPHAGLLVSAMFGLFALGIIQALFGGSWLQGGQLYVGTLVFCGYLVVNTQMMMGGDRKRQVRPDEHILASVNIYTDIINLFMHVLASYLRNSNRD